jgi:hypothetical protein
VVAALSGECGNTVTVDVGTLYILPYLISLYDTDKLRLVCLGAPGDCILDGMDVEGYGPLFVARGATLEMFGMQTQDLRFLISNSGSSASFYNCQFFGGTSHPDSNMPIFYIENSPSASFYDCQFGAVSKFFIPNFSVTGSTNA